MKLKQKYIHRLKESIWHHIPYEPNQKVENIGIHGTVKEWLNSYLPKRYQRVRINNIFIRPIYSEFGILQGTVLGPMLFIIYVNEMLAVPKIKRKIMYLADDSIQIIETSPMMFKKIIVSNI